MKLTVLNKIFLITQVLLLTLTLNSYAGKIPKSDMAVLICQNSEYGIDLTNRIALNIERELREKGYGGRLELFFDPAIARTSKISVVSLTVLKSQWRTDKAFSIPFILNRKKRVFEIELFIEFIGRDGKKYAERLSFAQAGGIQAQVLTNDYYDPDLFPDQSSRLIIEDGVIRKLAREIANKLGAKLS